MKKERGYFISVAVCAVFLVGTLFPFLWMLNLSFLPREDIYRTPPSFFSNITLEHYGKVFQQKSFLTGMKNSAVVALSCTAITVVFSSMAAYALTRHKSVYGKSFSFLLLGSRMIPSIVIGIPLYIISFRLRILGSLLVPILAISSFTVPLQVWFLTDFFRKIPKALDDAASIDGCSHLQIFTRIALPLSLPGLASSAILSFLFAWNDLFFALILTQKDTKTGVISLLDFMGYRMADWGAIMASSIILMLPTIVIGTICSKYVINGLVAGAVKE